MADDIQNVGGVSGAGVISLKINGETPPPSVGLIRGMHIVENTFSVPTLLLDLVDRNNMLRNDFALVDGTVLDIIVGTDMDTVEEFSFRVFKVQEIDDEDSARNIKVTALFNFPTFLYDTRAWNYKGNSIGALQYVADETGLTFDTDVTTNDVMKWVGAAQSARQFCSYVEQHSYQTDKSFIRSAFTADGRIIVRDLNTQILRKVGAAILAFNKNPEPNEYMAHEFRPKSSAGVMNAVSNYGEKTVYNNSKGEVRVLSSMEHESDDPMNVSAEVREQIHGSKKSYVRNTTDINLHDNWVKAEYLWKRHAASYTETAKVLILSAMVSVNLLDAITVRSYVRDATGGTADPKTSGNWIVIGKTLTFAQNRYSTVLLLARNFTGVQGSTEVGEGENKAETVFDTVANLLRPYQINLNISQILGELNPIDALANMQDGLLQSMKDGFKEMSEKYGFDELIEKYGEGSDYLLGLMQEFNLARFLTGICQGLNVLEKLSLNISIELGDTILQDIASRLDDMEDLKGSFMQDIQNLIDKGDIPEEYLDGVQINQRCVSNRLNDLEQNINDAFPSKCLDAFSIGRLTAPSFQLGNMIRQMEEYLRNMLCAMGDGTVDGSNSTGTPDGLKIGDYRPVGEWSLER